jgi:hypothetical protein
LEVAGKTFSLAKEKEPATEYWKFFLRFKPIILISLKERKHNYETNVLLGSLRNAAGGC